MYTLHVYSFFKNKQITKKNFFLQNLSTCFKHKFDSLNTNPTPLQYLIDKSYVFDDMFRLSNLCLKEVQTKYVWSKFVGNHVLIFFPQQLLKVVKSHIK
jgi:hypothetical protein